VIIMLGSVGLMTQTISWPQPKPQPATTARIDQLPAVVEQAPKWTADVQDAPLERALAVVGVQPYPDSLLTVVGPDDEYRTYDMSRNATAWDGKFILSPDGRYLMTGHDQQTQLLDVTTGKTRMLDAGAPMAWSPDGRQALLLHFDGPIDASEVSGEIRIVNMPSGEVEWVVPLAPGPLPRQVDGALSPDGLAVAVQRHGDMYVYRRAGGTVWQRGMNSSSALAGERPWAADSRSFVVAEYAGYWLLVDASTGKAGRSMPVALRLKKLGERVSSRQDVALVAWQGEVPIGSTSREIVRLSETPEILLTVVPEDSFGVQIATERIDWTSRQPGPPDPGPMLQRLRPARYPAGLAILAVVAIIMILRRRSWALPRSRSEAER
jgi:hypothetical protein